MLHIIFVGLNLFPGVTHQPAQPWHLNGKRCTYNPWQRDRMHARKSFLKWKHPLYIKQKFLIYHLFFWIKFFDPWPRQRSTKFHHMFSMFQPVLALKALSGPRSPFTFDQSGKNRAVNGHVFDSRNSQKCHITGKKWPCFFGCSSLLPILLVFNVNSLACIIGAKHPRTPWIFLFHG